MKPRQNPTNYYPVGWTILKFTYTEEVVYKIFATWRWGNEEWRLSSGATDLSSITKTGDTLVWPQASGSIYHLPLDGENCYTFYQGSVLEKIRVSCEKENIGLEVISLNNLVP